MWINRNYILAVPIKGVRGIRSRFHFFIVSDLKENESYEEFFRNGKILFLAKFLSYFEISKIHITYVYVVYEL